jgi:HD-GYP domain-containing protein (c-di-GMP phosphodiesterase class II)
MLYLSYILLLASLIQQNLIGSGVKSMTGLLVTTQNLRPGMIIAEPVLRHNQILLKANTILTTSIIQHFLTWRIPTVRVIEGIAPDISDECKPEIATYTPDQDQYIFKEKYTKFIKLMNEIFDHMRRKETVPYWDFRRLAAVDLYELSQDKTILAKLYQLKSHTDYTSGHAVDTGIIAGVMGSWLKFHPDKIKNLILCGLMHDVGKSQIPKSILEKPGPLTAEERHTVNLHPEYGYDMVKNISDIPVEVKLSILHHHERENGKGYPRKELSCDIHPFAKIVAIADIYDAMTTERCYQKSVSPFAALEALIDAMYVQLDKTFCIALIQNICQTLIGAVVLLSDGTQAVVLRFPYFMSSKPVVCTKSGKVVDLYTKTKISVVDILEFAIGSRNQG